MRIYLLSFLFILNLFFTELAFSGGKGCCSKNKKKQKEVATALTRRNASSGQEEAQRLVNEMKEREEALEMGKSLKDRAASRRKDPSKTMDAVLSSYFFEAIKGYSSRSRHQFNFQKGLGQEGEDKISQQEEVYSLPHHEELSLVYYLESHSIYLTDEEKLLLNSLTQTLDTLTDQWNIVIIGSSGDALVKVKVKVKIEKPKQEASYLEWPSETTSFLVEDFAGADFLVSLKNAVRKVSEILAGLKSGTNVIEASGVTVSSSSSVSSVVVSPSSAVVSSEVVRKE